jgi:DNA replication protein DnaC
VLADVKKSCDLPLDANLRTLHLTHTLSAYAELAGTASTEGWSHVEFLAAIAAGEVAHRARWLADRRVRRAGFPFLKSVDDFDFSGQTRVSPSTMSFALSSDFVTKGHSIILSGQRGSGKTHLAVAVAQRAIQNGFVARYTTAAALAAKLATASRRNRFGAVLRTFTRPGVLVIDDIGRPDCDTDGGHLLFLVVKDRCLLGRAMILSVRESLATWASVLQRSERRRRTRTEAVDIFDRVLERAKLLRLEGPSRRATRIRETLASAGVALGPRATGAVLVVDLRRRRVTYRGRTIPTRPPDNLQLQPLLALAALARRPGEVVSMSQIAEDMVRLGALRRRALVPDARDLRYKLLHPFRLALRGVATRKEVDRLVETIPGVGLRLNAPGRVEIIEANVDQAA